MRTMQEIDAGRRALYARVAASPRPPRVRLEADQAAALVAALHQWVEEEPADRELSALVVWPDGSCALWTDATGTPTTRGLAWVSSRPEELVERLGGAPPAPEAPSAELASLRALRELLRHQVALREGLEAAKARRGASRCDVEPSAPCWSAHRTPSCAACVAHQEAHAEAGRLQRQLARLGRELRRHL